MNSVKSQALIGQSKLLPQNVKKNSRPAALVNKYGNGDPNKIIWVYHPQKRYIGMLVDTAFMLNQEVFKWVQGRTKNASEVFPLGKYMAVMW